MTTPYSPEKKQVSLTVPYELAKRLSFLRQAGAGEAINEAITDFIGSQIVELEKKMRIPDGAWKEPRVCVKCDGMMVLRTPSKPNGKPFWGCLSYPKCTHTASAQVKSK